MALSDNDKQYVQDLVNANVLTASMLNTVPFTVETLVDMLAYLSNSINEEQYIAFALQQSSQYVYIPDNLFDDKLVGTLIGRKEFTDTLYKYGIFPLKRVDDTLWIGVILPQPSNMQDIQNKFPNNVLGWTIITPKALSKYLSEFRQKAIL